ncbi:MAG: flagellar filament capping protein FliD [Burkholderiaceae bacterium]
MASISSAGLGSGLDVESIVTKLVTLEKQPIVNLQDKTTSIKSQISIYGKIQSAFSSLRDASSKLTNPTSWAALTATSSDPTTTTVAAGTGSGAGSYALKVTSLAAAQSVSSKAYAATDKIGAGTMTIELGKYGTDKDSFTGKNGVSPISVTIGADDTLSSVRDKINGANAGVVASVVTDANGSRLVIRSKDTGEANAFRISVADDDGNGADASGLSALAYDPTASIESMKGNVDAANAVFSVNGMDMSSATNNIEGAVDGLSFNLLKKGDSTINVSQDKDAIKKTITDFVTTYNSLMNMLRDNTKYDSGSKTAGALQGDSTAIGLQTQLRNLTSGGTTLGGSFARLADIGLEIGSAGTITVNDTKLSSALGKTSDLKNLFMGVDAGNAENTGMAQRWRTFADQVMGVDGSITSRTTGLQSRVTANDKRADELTDRAASYEKRLRAQYTALDTQMAKLTDLQSYVSKLTSMLTTSS